MPRIDLGTIVGVACLPVGAVLGAPDQIQNVERALRDGYYFIVETDAAEGAALLRPVSRIELR